MASGRTERRSEVERNTGEPRDCEHCEQAAVAMISTEPDYSRAQNASLPPWSEAKVAFDNYSEFFATIAQAVRATIDSDANARDLQRSFSMPSAATNSREYLW